MCIYLINFKKGQASSQQVNSSFNIQGCVQQRNSINAVALMVFYLSITFMACCKKKFLALQWFQKHLLYSAHRAIMGYRWSQNSSCLRLPVSALCKCQRQWWVVVNCSFFSICICMPDQSSCWFVNRCTHSEMRFVIQWYLVNSNLLLGSWSEGFVLLECFERSGRKYKVRCSDSKEQCHQEINEVKG